MILILIILFGILILSAVVYLTVTLLTRLILMLTGGSNKSHYNNFAIIFSIGVSIAFGCYYVFSNPAHNYKTAYIEQTDQKYIVTIYSKRSLMSHDPISALLGRTYLDSAKLELLECDGVIDGTEVTYRNTYFEFLKGSSINIKRESLEVRLEYIDSYDKKKSELYLNGQYKLEWRK